MAKAVPILSDNPSRDEEMAFLRAVVDRIPQNSYLATLLRPDAVDWFVRQMRSDLSCDLLGLANYNVNQLSGAEAELRTARERNTQLEGMLKAERELLAAAREAGKAEAERLAELHEQLRDQYDKLLSEFGQRHADLLQAQAEVQHLKAELFDLYRATGRI